MFQDLLTNFSSDIPGYKDNEGEGGSNDRSAGSPIVIEERVAVLIGSMLRSFNIGQKVYIYPEYTNKQHSQSLPELVVQEDMMQTTSKQIVIDLANDEEQPAASPGQLQTSRYEIVVPVADVAIQALDVSTTSRNEKMKPVTSPTQYQASGQDIANPKAPANVVHSGSSVDVNTRSSEEKMNLHTSGQDLSKPEAQDITKATFWIEGLGFVVSADSVEEHRDGAHFLAVSLKAAKSRLTNGKSWVEIHVNHNLSGSLAQCECVH